MLVTTRAEMLAAVKADYVSAAKDLGPRGLYRINPSLGFYRRVSAIILRCSEFGREGRFSNAIWAEYSGKVVKAFEEGGVPVIVENLEVFDRFDKPCVIIGNHMSTAETFIPPSLLCPYRPITYVVKQTLIDYPIFKHIMRATDPVVVGRTDPRQDLKTVLEEGEARLREGISLIIFPQRTRTVEFRPAEFNSIGVKVARRAGVPVVPLAVKTDAWSNGKRLKDFGPFQPDKPAHFAFGEPMEVTGSGKQQNDAVIEFIQEHLAAWAEWDAHWREAGR